MKSKVEWILSAACIWVLAQTAFAQVGYSTPATSPVNNVVFDTNNPARTFFHARSLVGQQVKDAQVKTLATIYDIAFNPQSGDTFAALGVGSGRYALIPWQALVVNATPRGDIELKLNLTLRDLQSAPTVASSDWDRLKEPAFTQRIYAYFGMQPPLAVGGIAPNSLGGSSTGTGASTPKDTSRTATAQP